jgi:hypothetical protein
MRQNQQDSDDEDYVPEYINHRAVEDAKAWAQSHGIPHKDLLLILSKISDGNHRLEIRNSEIRIGTEIDKGSFGSICLAQYRQQDVVIKRVSKVRCHSYTCTPHDVAYVESIFTPAIPNKGTHGHESPHPAHRTRDAAWRRRSATCGWSCPRWRRSPTPTWWASRA